AAAGHLAAEFRVEAEPGMSQFPPGPCGDEPGDEGADLFPQRVQIHGDVVVFVIERGSHVCGSVRWVVEAGRNFIGALRDWRRVQVRVSLTVRTEERKACQGRPWPGCRAGL